MKVRSSVILTVILSLEMDLNPVVLDPDNSAEPKKDSRIVFLHGNNWHQRQRGKRKL